jgi:hypothetical protein
MYLIVSMTVWNKTCMYVCIGGTECSQKIVHSKKIDSIRFFDRYRRHRHLAPTKRQEAAKRRKRINRFVRITFQTIRFVRKPFQIIRFVIIIFEINQFVRIPLRISRFVRITFEISRFVRTPLCDYPVCPKTFWEVCLCKLLLRSSSLSKLLLRLSVIFPPIG